MFTVFYSLVYQLICMSILCALQIMAAMDSVNPFSPEMIQKILHHLQQPAVFMNMTHGWPVLCWTAEHLSGCLGDKLVRFRLGRKEETNSKNRL